MNSEFFVKMNIDLDDYMLDEEQAAGLVIIILLEREQKQEVRKIKRRKMWVREWIARREELGLAWMLRKINGRASFRRCKRPLDSRGF